MRFHDENYLLKTELARDLYHTYCEDLPIIDYHCHISPKEIAENRVFSNVSELWLGGDHYKWRLMREHGVPERYITGDATDREKFDKWLETVELAIGNPLSQWSRMELSMYFGYNGPLRADLGDEIWEQCSAAIREQGFTARSIIQYSGVELLCTTDDPIDTLEWHRKLKEAEDFPVTVLPAYRPDRLVKIESEGFPDYIQKLGKRYGIRIRSYHDLLHAVASSIDYFDSMGCRTADHGIDRIPHPETSGESADGAFRKALDGECLTNVEVEAYQMKILCDLAGFYLEHGWIMQIHSGARRNNNSRMYGKLGPDTGYDCISSENCGAELPGFLDALDRAGTLPKMVLYSLDPNDDLYIDTVVNCFQRENARGAIQHGAAWWFNDTLDGIRTMLRKKASNGMIADFVGMLTDSRSFISYSRHDYFRRVLCQAVSDWIEDGWPEDSREITGRIISDISYYNVKRFFGFGGAS